MFSVIPVCAIDAPTKDMTRSGCQFSGNKDGVFVRLVWVGDNSYTVAEALAHYPYIIYTGTHSSQTTVNYIVGVKNLKAGTEEERETLIVSESATHLVNNVSYCFIGNYEEEEIIPQNTYYCYGGDNTYTTGFYKTNSGNSVRFTVNSSACIMSKNYSVKGIRQNDTLSIRKVRPFLYSLLSKNHRPC